MDKTVSYSYARQNLSSLLEEVTDNAEVLCIERQNGKKVIMIEESDYNSLCETAYLLRSPHNASQLFKALEEAKHNKGIKIEL